MEILAGKKPEKKNEKNPGKKNEKSQTIYLTHQNGKI